ncbi:MAG TPA: hypothetical protein VEA81_09125 [Burkholderiaceae bacterium]|nr:hypothetical protein [Burkholderiaceae bacterium]
MDRFDARAALRRFPRGARLALAAAAATAALAGCDAKPGDGATGVNPPASTRKGDQMPQVAPSSSGPASGPAGSAAGTPPSGGTASGGAGTGSGGSR